MVISYPCKDVSPVLVLNFGTQRCVLYTGGYGIVVATGWCALRVCAPSLYGESRDPGEWAGTRLPSGQDVPSNCLLSLLDRRSQRALLSLPIDLHTAATHEALTMKQGRAHARDKDSTTHTLIRTQSHSHSPTHTHTHTLTHTCTRTLKQLGHTHKTTNTHTHTHTAPLTTLMYACTYQHIRIRTAHSPGQLSTS